MVSMKTVSRATWSRSLPTPSLRNSTTMQEREDRFVDEDELDYLVVNNKRLKQATKRLNKELARVQVEFKNDKNDAIKDLKGKIKQWRKYLGKERSEKIKLEKKVVLVKPPTKSPGSSRNEDESEEVSEKF